MACILIVVNFMSAKHRPLNNRIVSYDKAVCVCGNAKDYT